MESYPYHESMVFGMILFLQVTLVAVLALVAIRMAGSRRAAIRHTIAQCALAAILLCPILTFFMRHYELSVVSFEMKDQSNISYYDASLSSLNGISDHIVTEMDSGVLVATPTSSIKRLYVDNPIGRPMSDPKGLHIWGSLLFWGWLAGFGFMFLRLIYGLGFQYACLRKGRAVEMDLYPIVMERLQSVLNGKAVPQVVSSRLVDHPLAVGLFRQRIILPAAMLEAFDEERLSDVLIHESSHVVHGDLPVGFFQRIAAIVFWPHPLLHMLNRKLARAREEVCDNYVLKLSRPHHYAQTLLDMTAVDIEDCRIPGTVGLLGFNWKLEDRIKGLLDKRRSMMTQTKRWKMGLVFALFFTGTLGISLVTVQGASGNSTGKTAEISEQINAVLLDLANRKEVEIQMLSKKLGIDVPPEFQTLIDAVKENSPIAEILKIEEKINREVGQYPESESNRLQSPLWSGPVLDLLGATSEIRTWSAPMLSLYAHGILETIPDNSIYFGGTDPGRFIITAFNSTTNESPISIITQNALADNSYMNYLRMVYGERLNLPTQIEINALFMELLNEDQGKSDGIKKVDGKLVVEGVANVMKINSKIAQVIFEKNKENHEFYVEESYALSWMYPYLEPHGLIMKLNREAIELSDAGVKRDTIFWNDLCKKLRESDSFATDIMAQKTFSKLRASIAGLYANRNRLDEAEAAFRQAMSLHPGSFEPVARLANLYAQQDRVEESKEVLARFSIQNPNHKKVLKMLENR